MIGAIALQIQLARPDHWFKNVFMLPGAALAIVLSAHYAIWPDIGALLLGIIATCLLASANYTINEWLDAEFDRFHPVKKQRPAALGLATPMRVYAQWCLLSLIGLGLSATLGWQFFLFAALLLLMGIAYNVRPIRLKDRLYLDVLSESLNNPIRFMLGWSTVSTDIFPPSSILLAFWMGGAYLMTVKRYAEYRFIADPDVAASYRRSFRYYSEPNLLVSAFFYGLLAAFFLGVFLIKYRIEFIIALPFLALLFAWYLNLGMRVDSIAQRPEALYKEWKFAIYVCFVGFLISFLFFYDMPWLNVLVEHHVLSTH